MRDPVDIMLALLVVCLIGLFIYGMAQERPEPFRRDCICECKEIEGCEVKVFKKATCAVGPGRYFCCITRTQRT